jgi:signal transduction histidine kinase
VWAYSKRLPDNSILSVGQDLSVESEQTAALTNTLFWCGALGIGIGLAVSSLFIASSWQRVSALARATREASRGRLDVRVKAPTHALRDDIDELAITFNTMLSEIGVLMNQVQQVSTAVAHDLRAPLTRVRQRMERLALTAGATPELATAIAQVDMDLGELSRTFDAMLRLAEIENTCERRATETVDVGDLAARIAEAFRPEIEETAGADRGRQPAHVTGHRQSAG